MPIKKNSWFWENLIPNTEFVTIEVYGLSTKEAVEQINLAKENLK